MIAHVKLTKLLDYDKETGAFTWLVRPSSKIGAGEVAGSFIWQGYRRITICKRTYSEQRLAFFWMTGKWPRHQIDHINLDKADNRWCNLREATITQNAQNRRGTTKFKGATYHKQCGKWQAQIRINGLRTYLGLFDTPEDAHEAYIKAARKGFGKFARAA